MSSNSNNSVLKGLIRGTSQQKITVMIPCEVDVVFSDNVWREKWCFKAISSFGTTKVAFNMNFLSLLLEYVIKKIKISQIF